MNAVLSKLNFPFTRKRALLFSLLLCVIAELSLFNLPFYASSLNGKAMRLYTPDELVYPYEEEPVLEAGDGYLTLSGTLGEVRSVRLLTDPDAGLYKYTLLIQDEAYSKDFREVGEFVSHAKIARSQVATIRSNGNLSTLRVELSSADKPLFIRGIVLNESIPFHISLLRMAMVFAGTLFLLYLLRGNVYRVIFDADKPTHKKACAALSAVLALLCLFTFASAQPHFLAGSDAFFTQLQPQAERYSDLYHRQLDAFLKGQVSLDLPVSEQLRAMENPYDPSARAEGNVPYQYDHAYYNGRYYSPLSPAPLLLYIPLHLLTGQFPSTALICLLFALGFVLFACLSAYELARQFLKGTPVLFVLLMPAMLVLCGAVLWGQRTGSFYEVPHISAAAFLMMALFFALKTRATQSLGAIALCSAALILTIGSRAVLGIAAFPVIFLLARIHRLIQKPATAATFLLPLVAGAVLLLYYNDVRFGSFLESGLRYQLAISDLSKNSISNLWNIIPAAYHYLLQIATLDTQFPYVRTSGMGQILYHNYYYCWPTAGAIAYPVVLTAPLGVRCAKSQNRPLRRLILLCILSGLLCIYLNFSLYGVFFRLTIDGMLLLSLAAALSVCCLAAFAIQRPCYRTIFSILFLLTLLSCLSGLFLSLDGYYGAFEKSSPLLFVRLKYMIEWWR